VIYGLLGFGMVGGSQVVWPWISWVANGYLVRFRGLQIGVAMDFRWVSGEVLWVANGCGHGSQVHLEWVTKGSQWLRFCGFFCHRWWWLAMASCRLLGLVAKTLLIGRMLERNKKIIF